MAELGREAHARMLGNGPCTRPVELDCRMEAPVRPAATSIPSLSPGPPSSPNEATPNNTTNPNASLSSTDCSTVSTRVPLDNDHPYNAGSGAIPRSCRIRCSVRAGKIWVKAIVI
jgi:hypothetical protein